MDSRSSKLNPDAQAIRLHRAANGDIVLALGDKESYTGVQIVLAAPLSNRDRYFCFLNSAGEEICMLASLDELKPEDRRLAEDELRKRYLTSKIYRIVSVRRESGTLYCNAETDRGAKELTIRHSPETVRWLGKHSLHLVDVDGSRFEVPDVSTLDRRSARALRENFR